MSKKLFFAKLGYRISKELGSNREAGRITYLAEDEDLEEQVVIKEFYIARQSTNNNISNSISSQWDEINSSKTAIEREVDILQQLSHPRIPRYLTSFETPQGLCLVQEYKKAPSLAKRYSFTLKEIQQISISVLEILVYLQQRFPAIIHRDIKPENILVDKELNAHLVDFGLARLSSKNLSANSIVAGTLGFMAPEEYFGHSPTEASDLYSFGATLICLLSGTSSVDIGKLVNEEYRFDLEKLKPKLSSEFAIWLSKMVEPSLKNRFPDAITALKELQSIPVLDAEESALISQFKKAIDRVSNKSFIKLNQNFDKSIRGYQSLSFITNIKIFSALVIFGIISVNILSLILSSNTFAINFAKENIDIGNLKSDFTSLNSQLIYKNQDKQRDKPGFTKLLKTNNCWSCNLNHITLVLANLKNANLEASSIMYADLERVNFQNANLKNTFLEESNLERANLMFADLSGSLLEKVELRNANLQGANLESANLRRANILDARFKEANLKNSDLRNVYAVGTNFQYADLTNTNLAGAKLQNSNLRNANLTGANLSYTNLRGASLKGAKLQNVNLEGAILVDVDLTDTNLEGVDPKIIGKAR